jgi:hypothetical protein
MAVRTHVARSGHDANAWDQDKKLTLRLERDVLGRVLHRPDEPDPESTGRFTLNGACWAEGFINQPVFDEDE